MFSMMSLRGPKICMRTKGDVETGRQWNKRELPVLVNGVIISLDKNNQTSQRVPWGLFGVEH